MCVLENYQIYTIDHTGCWQSSSFGKHLVYNESLYCIILYQQICQVSINLRLQTILQVWNFKSWNKLIRNAFPFFFSNLLPKVLHYNPTFCFLFHPLLGRTQNQAILGCMLPFLIPQTETQLVVLLSSHFTKVVANYLKHFAIILQIKHSPITFARNSPFSSSLISLVLPHSSSFYSSMCLSLTLSLSSLHTSTPRDKAVLLRRSRVNCGTWRFLIVKLS